VKQGIKAGDTIGPLSDHGPWDLRIPSAATNKRFGDEGHNNDFIGWISFSQTRNDKFCIA
jgi:hypothetical protein